MDFVKRERKKIFVTFSLLEKFSRNKTHKSWNIVLLFVFGTPFSLLKNDPREKPNHNIYLKRT
jgi:hypothetical protein